MMKAAKKQDLKRNALAEAVGAAVRFLQARRVLVLSAVAGIVVVGLAGGAYWWHQQRQEAAAARILVQAEDAVRPVAPDKAGKSEEAVKLFTEVADRYRGTASAEEALIRLGNLQYAAGKMDAAADAFARYQREYPSGPFALIAAIGQAYALEGKGDFQSGVQVLSAALDRQKEKPLAGEAYTTLARLYEELKKPEDATRIYRQIVDRYPQTQWAENAAQRLSALKAKS